MGLTGQDLKIIENAMERDYFMSAEEAKNFGIVDHVVTTRIDKLSNI